VLTTDGFSQTVVAVITIAMVVSFKMEQQAAGFVLLVRRTINIETLKCESIVNFTGLNLIADFA
jgi:hypothetical protein